ncbi:lipopolysaccharide assembly protein LapA domain-containing protein [Bacillus carboniphilus]|uniref:Lipopolysaccharide assembly protein LapA domain-containing protein n=1 Tax=Bacillus carboniphilus TaxID=86663 RepID=A0ABY9JS51_9BACI|nr:lipopolysaccharide assembly protein LapA domain-containing protein [Bacillus carboniphilus]WLR42229.1 lipopolysaccharide assembly protein LapA domain-containing protein [Bacillus carboniphilus]
MKIQRTLLLAFIFALIVAIFAVVNVDAVEVNYVFGTAEWPLILVILGSVLMGGLIVGAVGIVRVFNLQRVVKQKEKEIMNLNAKIEELEKDRPVSLEEPIKEESAET